MNMYPRLLCAVILSICVSDIVLAASNYSYTQNAATNTYNNSNNVQTAQYPQNNVLQGNVVMVPAGATVTAMVTTPISSADMKKGEAVTMSLGNDFYYNGKIVAPAGSIVSGTVIEASKAKRGSMNGKLCIRFNMLTTPYGVQIPISAVIKTEDSTGLLVGGTKMDVTKEYTKDLAAGAAVGALSGLVFGSLASGDKLGRGVALGTAVGAGGGLAKSVWDKGNDVDIPSGASIELQLTQPMAVSVPSYQFEN